MAPFEILEHTADVGIRATGDTLEEAFASAGRALAELLGAWFPGEGEERLVAVGSARDPGDLLAVWLDELLFIHERDDIVFGRIEVDGVTEHDLAGRIWVAPRGERRLEGTGVKATTYHRLRVEREEDGGWILEAYLDV